MTANKFKLNKNFSALGTCGLLLGFVIFPWLSFATPDIPQTPTTQSCDDGVLDSDNGTVDIEINWEPNNIELHWYDRNTELTVPSESRSCTYDSTLNPPSVSVVPTRTGYTFKGWRAKNLTCGVSTLNNVMPLDCAAKASNVIGDCAGEQVASAYNLTENDTWAIEYENGGVLRGEASCNNTLPSNWNNISSMTADQKAAALYGTNKPGILPSDTFNRGGNGQYCWCRMTDYTPNNGNICSFGSSTWAFIADNLNDSNPVVPDCSNICAFGCIASVAQQPELKPYLWITY